MRTQDNERQRVLVIDGESANDRIYRQVLGNYGFSVDIITDRNQAIYSLHDRCYDLCILDLHMPGVDEIQLDEYLKEDNKELNRGVIFTAADIKVAREATFREDPDKVYLKKPFTPRELMIAVELALN
jgi:CheY-like chemotaxis protein